MTLREARDRGYSFRGNQPVPFCVTVLRYDKRLRVISPQAREAVQGYLDAWIPGARIVGTTNGYVSYEIQAVPS